MSDIKPEYLLLGLIGAFGVWVLIRSKEEGVSPTDYIKGMIQGQFRGAGR